MNESVEGVAAPLPLYLRIWRNTTFRTLSFMLLRLAAFILLVAGLAWLARLAIPLPQVKESAKLAETGADLWLRGLRGILPLVIAYWILVRVIERRRVSELAARKAVKHSVVGWLVGTGILLLAAGLMALFGTFSIESINSNAYLLGPLVVMGLVPGIGEEIIARGILFRVFEEGLGTWVALAISALLFGFGHYANPNATAWSSIAIAIEAGLLLGMAYAWTRSLWFVMALHAAWNFTQGGLLGIPVSGFDVDGLLISRTHGPVLLSGGEFGAEASILTLILCVTVAGYFTRKAIAAGRIVPPCWLSRTPGVPVQVDA